MKVIVLASLKGGSGKTTLSGHLAVEAERAGAGPVALIDMDPQGSLSDWWNARKGETPRFAKVESQNLGAVLQRLRGSGIHLAVIDTPAALTQMISEGIAQADLVLVPTRPSVHNFVVDPRRPALSGGAAGVEGTLAGRRLRGADRAG